ncbi:hypothetical protein OZX69_05860 [Lactobacillus sp. ESL0731]|uniref:hypothetical protein n=1 Tax=unclassified Lactobacillus TaxID=2620435 RepID=UPI0023F86B3B|nr:MULTISPECIES: hypothetical protein [unclassified Lactobacillus]WEV50487.1 hypothetical protein OZX63_05855 [Lactobacillus sp. ESL0700]WEV61617.1 hypothetical protein OZX69_05860 [Lactobacillus sp. ESL0731]
MKNSLKKIYHYLFTYDDDRLSIYNQAYRHILTALNFALLHRDFVMITYPNDTSEIGQIVKRVSAGRFILRSNDRKILKIIDVSNIFRIDLA